ncbi:unnamed protein product [Rotaria sp. Silwood2]|nr:unnamed protein product [Rotaria sp. Silwood2]CAF3994105.1 unnamed protein product [Rotaria sp. Silwood2]CAF4387573.1 unnamed protein product [Rotaria sp. Silwood2]CAF4709170.1 unnamed protein product [Rotaria sp. Silwood2]
MANCDRNIYLVSTHSRQRVESIDSSDHDKSPEIQLQKKSKRQLFVVLYAADNCPLHGSRGKCTCASFVNDDANGVGNDGMGSSESLHRSGDFGQQNYENNEKTDDLVSASVKPYNNNPPLPATQRDIVGNNLRFNSRSLNNNNWIDDENDQLAALLLYRDALKKNLTTSTKAGVGFPRMRHGRIGSQWRHIKQTNTYSGSNLMFIDGLLYFNISIIDFSIRIYFLGTVRVDDSYKYPIPRFGYPPMKRPQHRFSASYNDSSFTSANPATHSLDALTWSQNETLNRRPSLTRNSNRSQHYTKDNLSYRPPDSAYKKNASTNYLPVDNKEYEAKQTMQEHIRPGFD